MNLSGSALFVCLFMAGIVSLKAQDSSYQFRISPTFYGYFYTHDKLSLKDDNPLLIGTIPFERKKFYAELRYNYDQSNTIALYAGRKCWLDQKKEHSLIPQVGVMAGDYTGVSAQLYYQYLRNDEKWEVNLQQQYSIPTNHLPSFYYNWSDASHSIGESAFSIGASMQIYSDADLKYVDGGVFLGVELGKDWSLEFYSFNFYKPTKHYLVVGVVKDMKRPRTAIRR